MFKITFVEIVFSQVLLVFFRKWSEKVVLVRTL
jgi:hypothetical protein